MAYKNTPAIYGPISRALHWLVGLAVICMLIVGSLMESIADKAIRGQVFGLHKSMGITVMGIMIVFALWSLFNRKPKLPKGTPTWEHHLARTVHLLLYALIIAMPLSGWIMSTASNHIPNYFGLFKIPFPGIGQDKALAEFMETSHYILAWSITIILTLHVLGALKHHFIYKNNIVRRMLLGPSHSARASTKIEMPEEILMKINS